MIFFIILIKNNFLKFLGVPADKANGIIKNLIPNEKMLQPKINKKNQLFEKTLQTGCLKIIFQSFNK